MEREHLLEDFSRLSKLVSTLQTRSDALELQLSSTHAHAHTHTREPHEATCIGAGDQRKHERREERSGTCQSFDSQAPEPLDLQALGLKAARRAGERAGTDLDEPSPRGVQGRGREVGPDGGGGGGGGSWGFDGTAISGMEKVGLGMGSEVGPGGSCEVKEAQVVEGAGGRVAGEEGSVEQGALISRVSESGAVSVKQGALFSSEASAEQRELVSDFLRLRQLVTVLLDQSAGSAPHTHSHTHTHTESHTRSHSARSAAATVAGNQPSALHGGKVPVDVSVREGSSSRWRGVAGVTAPLAPSDL